MEKVKEFFKKAQDFVVKHSGTVVVVGAILVALLILRKC